MIRQIGLLHTVGFLADMFRNLFQESIPEVNSFHIVDEGIIKQLMENDGLTPAIVRRIALQAGLAMEAGADLILFTCSSTSPAVDTVRNLIDIPIMKIDDPLADKAVELGEKIGLITTAKTTLKPSIDLISSRAAEKGKPVEIDSTLETDAFKARLNGNVGEHDRIVKAAIDKLSAQCDVIVLAQASMAHLVEQAQDSCPVPILASPELCMSALKDLVTGEK
ncbi:MAG: aspartate/glutamate racemase family protein [Deltaproteobacteria bacterium]|nr:aspartate/glutamate racemase family protein [Deltaproteobacteria bacterium]